MKKICLLLPLCLLFFCAPALARQLDLGGVSISYEIPQGFVAAMDGPYKDTLNMIRQAMPKEVTVHALFVPAKVDAEFRSGGKSLPAYLLLSSTTQLEAELLSKDDFSSYKNYLLEHNGRLEPEKLSARLTEALAGSAERAKAGQILSLGCFAEGDFSTSLMVMLTQVVIAEGEHTLHDQAMITTSLVAQGKMFSVTQYRLVETAAEALDFQAAAQAVVQSMGFQLGGVAQSSGVFERAAPAQPQAAEGGSLDAIMAAALAALAAGGIFMFLRSRKRG